ncbi:hypothetical protein GRI48_14135 [Altererythrobacter oceanensis]|uniref:Tail specific protease domain-containing protein n=1 Tax=Qipengyuania oceanensis TaxID=1463597 RepID=A0A844YL65_9SPHN|nr:hypothetical protein [Qipengyuania oceanensis]
MEAEESGNPWQLIAREDARAALELIESNHPGADPSLGDARFLERIRIARANVEQRLTKVDSYPAYNALMSGLAADFGDGHIWSTALVEYKFRAWTGIILSRRGGAWIVGAQEQHDGERDIVGFRLVSCDGADVDAWARERIGLFKGNPEVESQLAQNAAWLLLRDGNPFLTRPESCVLESPQGVREQVDLNWRQIQVADLEPFIVRAEGKRTGAGMGVEKFDRGYWIKLETLGAGAAEVVAEVDKHQKELRTAPMVVLDLRGNGGGDSSYASAIATTLVGAETVAAAARPADDCRGAFWRVSPGNLEMLRGWRDRLARDDAKSFSYVSDLVQDMEAALIESRAFAPALPSCAREPSTEIIADGHKLPSPEMLGRLVLLTDRSCFSSCLIAADLFLRLGALHVGEATDVSTRYMEVRQEVLPSGIRTFSTLQKVALGLEDYGPFEPEVNYSGDLADTEKIQGWISQLQ